MIDMRRFLKEFGPHVLHYQAKDLMIDVDGLYERGVFSMGMGWQVPRIPGLGEVDWSVVFSELYRQGFEGDCIIEHEDRRLRGHRRAGQAGLPDRARRAAARTADDSPPTLPARLRPAADHPGPQRLATGMRRGRTALHTIGNRLSTVTEPPADRRRSATRSGPPPGAGTARAATTGTTPDHRSILSE